MNNKVKIKIIKKGEIKFTEIPEVSEIKREENNVKLTSTVSAWINEFKSRRREETELAAAEFYNYKSGQREQAAKLS